MPGQEAKPTTGERARTREGLRSRVWELELLLSGAVLFALLQAPARVDRLFESLEPQLGGAAYLGWFLLFYYLKLTLYTLVGAFLVHLVLRASWIALVGLDSVFPRGVRWDAVKAGPIAKRLLRRMLPSLGRQIYTTGAAASIVFAFAFTVVVLFLLSVPLIAVVGGAVALLVTPLAGDRAETVTIALAYLVLLAFLGLGLLDRYRGDRLLERPGRLVAWVRGGLAAWYRLIAVRWYGPTMLTLQSNLGRRFLPLFAFTFSFGLVVFLVQDVALRHDRVRFGGAGYLPDDPGAQGFETRHYEDRRPPGGHYSRVPSIPSEVIRGPYVRLFVPLRPEPTREGMELLCPDLEPLPGGPVRVVGREAEPPAPDRLERILDCLGRLHRVELDGAPLEELDWAFYELPEVGAHGLAAFLPASGLTPGRHLLTVARTPLPDDDEPPPVEHIPFLR